MGRFLSGGSGSVPRKQSVRLLASNPSVAIPSWARVAYVTGCGSGASGSIGDSGGGAGAFAVRHPVLIPDGVTTLAAVIGAAGAAVTGSAAAPGNIGGATTMTMGSTVLRLNGGGNGASSAGGHAVGGWPYINSVAFVNNPSLGVGTSWLGISNPGGASSATGASAGAATLGPGAAGGVPTVAGAWGTGGSGPFGSAQPRMSAPAANASGTDAQGYGAGGTAASTSGGTVTSGAGSPGFLLIEFEEATTA